MKSKKEQLDARGFLPLETVTNFENISYDRKIELLTSKIATERTLGARLLNENKTSKTVEHLINALKTETRLYSKIEICNTLFQMEKFSLHPLINSLGKIGNNQHKKVPEKEFLKNSYPLPRDIASRTLIRMRGNVMPELLNALKSKDKRVLSELIDTIGHINFNSRRPRIYESLKSCYQKNNTEDLIKWKIIRAFSGIDESENFLNVLSTETNNERIKKEIKRSLRLIKNRNK
ncbi:hypothetical protein CW731_00220 [Polaribacter sp. ALD11]|uniref:hypothetical protein n=1 Tax=Polaribacter sp. ALD11 TaxID=2058137 RepID=UPI000C30BE46|nr:hypothetical protein [Polaribacter sp. ALD11]AUC83808.1 hypothetical protein CW731_00220 [Polaribacter sp. ALD11]